MRGSGRMRRVGRIAMAALVAMTGVVTGAGSSGVAPAEADCGTQLSRGIGAHRGFAVDGVVTSVEQARRAGEGELYRITIEVTDSLAGDPVAEVVFDTGTGDCWELQGERYKVGDRLILSAPRSPTEPQSPDAARYLHGALTWRYEWADHWTLHGLTDWVTGSMARRIRAADTRDEILALVAPKALPFRIEESMWRVTFREPGESAGVLGDVVAWRDGFVALGSRSVRGGRDLVEFQVRTSVTGERWSAPVTPFGVGRVDRAGIARLIVFRDVLYAVGWRDEAVRAWRSTDGRRWTRVLDEPWRPADPGRLPALVRPPSDLHVAANAERLIILSRTRDAAAGSSQVVWTTTDGETWGHAGPDGLFPSASLLIATTVGFAILVGDVAVQTSTDGVRWSVDGTQPAGVSAWAFDQAGARFLAATASEAPDGAADPVLVGSTDLAAWRPVLSGPGASSWTAIVTAQDDTLVLQGEGQTAVGPGTWTMTSRDAGATWTLSPIPSRRHRGCVYGLAIGASRMVAVGGCRGPVVWIADR